MPSAGQLQLAANQPGWQERPITAAWAEMAWPDIFVKMGVVAPPAEVQRA
jgi:hypothetical protein